MRYNFHAVQNEESQFSVKRLPSQQDEEAARIKPRNAGFLGPLYLIFSIDVCSKITAWNEMKRLDS